MPDFIPSLDLNEQFFHEILAPLMAEKFPDLTYAAARLGDGSDVLGYDTEISTDHDWGIRMQLFLDETEIDDWKTAVFNTLRTELPAQYKAFPVHFVAADEQGVRVAVDEHDGPVDHRITITTIRQFVKKQVNIDPYQPLDAIDWLTIPQQFLLTITKGRLFADPENKLAEFRDKFAYFPNDVWLYLMAMQWGRMGEEEHFVGRTGIVGDEIGSALLASRLVHDMMSLCFLMEKQYAPYAKWFGTAFNRLDLATGLHPIFAQILAATDWQTRQKWLCKGYSALAERHNGLGITEPLATACGSFFDRPFQVLYAGRFQAALMEKITDSRLLSIDSQMGSIDQISDNTQLKSYPHLHRRLRVLYGAS
ncbi:MAG: DUF4037 domain-containing protein [Chloroflexota bacterium]